LIKAAEQLAAERGPAGAPPSLVVGGAGLPLDIAGALANSDVDLLINTARDEARAFLACDPGARKIDQAMATGMLSQLLPGRAPEAYQHYSDRRPGAGPAEIAADALTDALFRMPVLRLAGKRGAYVSQFEWRSTPEFGACHTVDLPFALDNPAAWSDAPLLAGRDVTALQPLADRYSGALAEFVRTGVAPWPKYDAGRRMTMRFDDVVGPVSDPAGPERELWQVR
jgi:para-nitrobenzyl esterase